MRPAAILALLAVAGRASAQERLVLEGHTSTVEAVAVSPNGKSVASRGSHDEGIRLWDLAAGKPLALLASPDDEHGQGDSLSWSPDGKTIATNGGLLWDVASGKKRMIAQPMSDTGIGTFTVSWSPDGRSLAATVDEEDPPNPPSGNGPCQGGPGRCGRDHVVVWDTSGKRRASFDPGGRRHHIALTWSPDGKQLAVGVDDHSVRIVDASLGKQTAKIDLVTTIRRGLAWSPDGKVLAIGDDQKLVLWDVAAGTAAGTVEVHDAGVADVAFSPDGKWLVSASGSGAVKLWNVEKRKLKLLLGSHKAQATSVSFSPDGKTVVSGGEDKRVMVFEMP